MNNAEFLVSQSYTTDCRVHCVARLVAKVANQEAVLNLPVFEVRFSKSAL